MERAAKPSFVFDRMRHFNDIKKPEALQKINRV